MPLGTPLLYLVAIGLVAYAAFKLIDAAAGIDGHGDDAAGRAKRVGSAASGLAHLVLAYAAYEFASGARQQAAGDAGGQEVASGLLAWPLGWVVLGAIGLGFIAAAFFQAKNAYDAHFMKNISRQALASIETIGRVGHGARAVLFAIIGWSLIQSAWAVQSNEIKGLGAAIIALSNNGILYPLVAGGLILFGVFSLIAARYRIIPDVNAHTAKPIMH